MTPKESAKVIFGVLHDDWFSWTPEVVEAFSMAISALKKQEVDKCCETCKHKRHTAIEWPCRECYMSLCDIEDYYEPYTEEEA